MAWFNIFIFRKINSRNAILGLFWKKSLKNLWSFVPGESVRDREVDDHPEDELVGAHRLLGHQDIGRRLGPLHLLQSRPNSSLLCQIKIFLRERFFYPNYFFSLADFCTEVISILYKKNHCSIKCGFFRRRWWWRPAFGFTGSFCISGEFIRASFKFL